MSDLSPRRRLAGRIGLGAALFALPLTASISYAESEAPAAPRAPEAPAAPADAPAPPAPPAAPEAPPAPAPEGIEAIDPDTGEPQVSPQVRYESESEFVYVVEGDDPEGRKRKVTVKRIVDGDGRELSEKERAIVLERHREVSRALRSEQAMSEAEIEEIMAEVREGLAEADTALREVPAIVAEAMAEMQEAGMLRKDRTRVVMRCDPASGEVATTATDEAGNTVVSLCQERVMSEALKGIREARRSIAQNREMSASMRARILKELDRQIESWENAQS